MRRALAVVVAAGMVAAALAFRSRLDERSRPRPLFRVTCAPELEATCGRLRSTKAVHVRVTVEDAGTTAARLSGAGASSAGIDGWLTTAPWRGIVTEARTRAGLGPVLGPAGRPLARSPLVIAVWKDRGAVLARAPACRGQVDWRCLGDVAALPKGWTAIGGPVEWGAVKPAHDDPVGSATGLLVLGQATAAFFQGRTAAAGLSVGDLEDDAYRGWLAGLERAIPAEAFDTTSTESLLERMLVRGPGGGFDAVGTTEAEAASLLQGAAREKQVTLLYPLPVTTADVVLATVGRRAGAAGDVMPLVRRALAATGWRVGSRPPAGAPSGAPALPPTDGLPSAGLLDALRGAWQEARR